MIEEFVPSRFVGGEVEGRLGPHIVSGLVLQDILGHGERLAALPLLGRLEVEDPAEVHTVADRWHVGERVRRAEVRGLAPIGQVDHSVVAEKARAV